MLYDDGTIVSKQFSLTGTILLCYGYDMGTIIASYGYDMVRLWYDGGTIVYHFSPMTITYFLYCFTFQSKYALFFVAVDSIPLPVCPTC